jgi:hypothetical protein
MGKTFYKRKYCNKNSTNFGNMKQMRKKRRAALSNLPKIPMKRGELAIFDCRVIPVSRYVEGEEII